MLHAIADTHTVIWYIFADRRLSTTARMTIDNLAANGDQVGVSSMTLVEIVYLSERARIAADTLTRLLNAIDQSNSVLVEIPINRFITDAMCQVDRAQVPDLPDRVIAATAVYYNVPLISRDRKIQLSSINTIW